MTFEDLIIKRNFCTRKPTKNKFRFENKCWYYNIKTDLFINNNICDFLYVINYITSQKMKFPIIITIEKTKFSDKLVYIILECVCDWLLKNGWNVMINFSVTTTVLSNGIIMSPLFFLGNRNYKKEEFLKKILI